MPETRVCGEKDFRVGVLLELVHERLLFVEDEEGFRCVTAEALRANGYLVGEASGVQQARGLLEATSPCYDLAMIDVALADGDGFELAREISGRHPNCACC